jgi:hypothetical protein
MLKLDFPIWHRVCYNKDSLPIVVLSGIGGFRESKANQGLHAQTQIFVKIKQRREKTS